MHKELQEHRAQQVLREFKVSKVFKVRLVHKELQVLRALKESKVFKVFKAKLELRVLKVSRVFKDLVLLDQLSHIQQLPIRLLSVDLMIMVTL